MSGEVILQQWLDVHPEIVAKYEQQRRRRRRRKEVGLQGMKNGGGEGKKGEEEQGREKEVENVSQHSLNPPDQLPHYLEQYRGFLPPSLMPTSAKTAYPHTLLPDEVDGWG